MVDIYRRVRKTINWLIFNEVGQNEKEISEKLGYTKSSFSQIINGKVPLSDKFIKKLCTLDDKINLDWLLTGDGEMLRNETLFSSNPKIEEVDMAYKVRDLEETNEILLSEIRRLKEENEDLKQQLNVLNKTGA